MFYKKKILNTDKDKIWCEKLQKGNKTAFKQLFNKYHKSLFLFVNSMIKSSADAEEIIQDIFVKIWINRQRINPDLSIKAYLVKIARNEVYSYFRKKINEQKMKEYLSSNRDKIKNPTEEKLIYMNLETLLVKEIKRMPQKRQQIFKLSRMENLSHKEIAKKLNISTKTVENHISLALKHLKKSLSDYLTILFCLFFY